MLDHSRRRAVEHPGTVRSRLSVSARRAAPDPQPQRLSPSAADGTPPDAL